MTRIRLLLGLLFLTGVVISTLADRVSRIPLYADGMWILAADFHVHSFLGDGALPPWELGREAARRGLDVIAVTNHNNLASPRLAARFPRLSGGVLVLSAEELTAPGYHISAVGIREPIDWRLPAAGAIAAIHAQGGVAIASHPVEAYGRAYDDEALERLDGIEIAHPAGDFDREARKEIDAFFARARQRNPDVAPIGSSDFHFVQPMGLCRTYVFATEFSERGVLEAVREGRTVAFDVSGNSYGDPALARKAAPLVQGQGKMRNRGWAAAGALLSWASLVAAIVTGGRRRRPPQPVS